jgi:hypothetical protein
MSTREETLARYQRLRDASMRVNRRLMDYCPRDVLDEGGANLGLLRNGVLVATGEETLPALMDHCIHDVFRNGFNAVDRMLADDPPPLGTADREFLELLPSATLGVVLLEGIEPGIGAHAHDLLTGRRFFLADVGASHTGSPGDVFVARVVSTPEFGMTTGMIVSFARIPDEDRERWLAEEGAELKANVPASTSRERRGAFNGSVLGVALARRAGESPQEQPRPRRNRWAEAADSGDGVGRNDPCPCGSGKKYKRCCGAR